MFDGLIGVKDSGESLDLFFDGQDEPFTIAKHGNDSLVAQLMPYVVPDGAQGLQAGGIVLANAMPEPGQASIPTMDSENPVSTGDPEMDEAIARTIAAEAGKTVPTQGSLTAGRDALLREAALNEAAPPVAVPLGPLDPFQPFDANRPPMSDADLVEPGMTFPAEASTSNPVLNAYMLSTPAQARLPMANGAPDVVPLSDAEREMAQRTIAGREAGKFEAFKTQAAGAPPQVGASQGRRVGGSVSTSTRTPGESNLAFKANELPPDPEAEARALERAILADTMGEIALAEGEEMGRLATERALAEERYKKEYDEMVFKRDAEARQMRQEIMNGKVNPDRVYAEMGTAQKIGTMIGMIMGGLGTVGTGRDNPVIAAIRREVDRDIEIQKDSLDRKDSIYKQFLAEGRDSIEAWKLSRSMALDSIATKMQAAAARYGGEKEMLRAQEVGMKFEQEAAKERAEADRSYYARQLNEFKIVNDANAANATAKYQAERVKVDWYDAKTRRMDVEQKNAGAGKTLAVEIMPGQWIQAADPTAREKIAAGRDGHQSFIKGIEMLEQMRRKNPGGNIVPGWLAWMGIPDAVASKVGDSLAGAVQLAFLKAQGAGAYDKGSGALAQGIIESPATFFGTNDDAFFNNAAKLKSLANDEYMATIRGRMAPGQAPELFGSAPMNTRVVGRVP